MSDAEHGFDEAVIRERAYEISIGPDPGSPDENWLRAVDELRHERDLGEAAGRPEDEPLAPFPPNTAAITHP
jgi:hypothetical protein